MPAPPADPMPHKLLFVGWDGADWDVLRPLLDAGRLPNLAVLIAAGASGDLAARGPLYSPVAWTTLATGRHPSGHNVLGYVEPLPDGGGVRPADARGRTAAPFWKLAADAGRRVHVVGWPASDPAERTGGLFACDAFFRGNAGPTVEPADAAARLADLRLSPHDIDRAALRELAIPDAAIDTSPPDPRVAAAAAILAQAAGVQAAITWAMEAMPWDVAAVVYPGIEQCSQMFLPGRAQSGASFGGVVEATYAFHDLMLGRLMDLAGPAANVVLASDHGFATNGNQPSVVPRTAEESAILLHRSPGVFVAAGPGVKAGGRPRGARLVDVAPTLLALSAVASPAGLAGRPLAEVLKSPPKPAAVSSATATAWPDYAPDAAEEAAAHLFRLGYARPNSTADERAAAAAERGRRQALAGEHLAADRPAAAIKLFERLAAESPRDVAANGGLFESYLAAERHADAAALLDRLEAAGQRGVLLDLGRAQLALVERSAAAALEHLEAAGRRGLRNVPDWHVLAGRAYLRLARWDEAAASFGAALALDAREPRAWCGLSAAQVGRGDNGAAVGSARRAIEAAPDSGEPHLRLGIVLRKIGDARGAESSLRRCVEVAPDTLAAHRSLLSLYEGSLADPASAAEARAQLMRLRLDQRMRREAAAWR